MKNLSRLWKMPRGFSSSGSFWSAPLKWATQVFSPKEFDSRVEEDFPNWQEFSQQKLDEAAERQDSVMPLPPHKVFISSPLQWNFLFFLLVAGSLAMGWAKPDWAPFFIYGAILLLFLISLFYIVRDGIFFHLEGQRLEEDCEMINTHSEGPEIEKEPEPPRGFLRSLVRRKNSIFRSTLLQIHYQNVLRTFEQGNRRAQVSQESSINDVHTMCAQRGMKLVWTFIEVLPQLGLLGTLIGLGRMFLAFSVNQELPELTIIAGFGTALGTTILANLFVLMLRPLYMRNERAMNEILSTLQMLMATFILPTQHFVLGRRGGLAAFAPPPGPVPVAENPSQVRVARALEELNSTLGGMGRGRLEGGGGAVNRETLQLAEEVKQTMQSLRDAAEPIHVNFPAQAVSRLTEAMQTLTKKLDAPPAAAAAKGGGSTKQIEHDLLQLRMLNHDTLVLMEKLSQQLQNVPGSGRPLLSQNKGLRSQAFTEEAALGDSLAELSPEPDKRGRGGSSRSTRSRLFRGRR